MPLVKSFVEEMGGEVFVSSQEKNADGGKSGTTVTVILDKVEEKEKDLDLNNVA